MRVETSQLAAGCVLLNEVNGKSGQPIIPKNTVLTEEHIKVLRFFLVESVEISSKTVDGDPFIPKDPKQEESEQVKEIESSLLFRDHFEYVVTTYKKLFKNWQNGMEIDMSQVRKIMIPLLERMDEIGSAVYTLHHYTTKKDYFYYHSVAVGILAAFIGRKMGYNKGEWIQLGLGGFLSDSGMVKMDPAILSKESSLTSDELDKIRKHPIYSYRLLDNISILSNKVKLAVLQHHERLDGSGYPLGLTQGKIHMYARIIAVCDMYHAMTSERLYKGNQSPFSVMEEMQKEQYSTLDTQVVMQFIKSLADFSIGTRVSLSNQATGEIVFIENKYPTRPMVKLDATNDIISLKDKLDLYIEQVLL
ncbi:HD-GYP domain-containing protein (c-di-GMP phosphodiesterase class II) [Virgibacillus natechei]|uniref:HD-GYP domain-containing protein (C-di-GMP phosphodiesterase class II) n=1 Tax=Virgibacillus natechei TaxID=1216297 RepID=A0ABS4IJJ6_9BACI|nr:HD-GYP domain-containing protein [Virgibacillus natechei]MBP1971063.1 HD-GYP domain-containing protein (c-di-GMP phosphodiesterase class II) [Virgibacillus natechei]UZD13006.1 HD-GYP domain-containing protein [Virgibacillus natechei]